jgi:hypothetical protein
MRLLVVFPAFYLLAACSGYAIDYSKPKTSIISPELTRYGMDAKQSQCVSDRLGTTLSVWQLRQLQMRAASVTKGFSDPGGRLTAGDLLYVSRYVEDSKVAPLVATAVQGCGVTGSQLAASGTNLNAAATKPATPSAPPSGAAGTGSAAPVTWINLGSAPTGQSIAVDATSLRQEGAFRSGWFRLAKAGERNANSYLLRVDCAAQTINSMELRKHGPNGEVTEQRSYGPKGEGAAPARDGTVLEIAFLSLCS